MSASPEDVTGKSGKNRKKRHDIGKQANRVAKNLKPVDKALRTDLQTTAEKAITKFTLHYEKHQIKDLVNQTSTHWNTLVSLSFGAHTMLDNINNLVMQTNTKIADPTLVKASEQLNELRQKEVQEAIQLRTQLQGFQKTAQEAYEYAHANSDKIALLGDNIDAHGAAAAEKAAKEAFEKINANLIALRAIIENAPTAQSRYDRLSTLQGTITTRLAQIEQFQNGEKKKRLAAQVAAAAQQQPAPAKAAAAPAKVAVAPAKAAAAPNAPAVAAAAVPAVVAAPVPAAAPVVQQPIVAAPAAQPPIAAAIAQQLMAAAVAQPLIEDMPVGAKASDPIGVALGYEFTKRKSKDSSASQDSSASSVAQAAQPVAARGDAKEALESKEANERIREHCNKVFAAFEKELQDKDSLEKLHTLKTTILATINKNGINADLVSLRSTLFQKLKELLTGTSLLAIEESLRKQRPEEADSDEDDEIVDEADKIHATLDGLLKLDGLPKEDSLVAQPSTAKPFTPMAAAQAKASAEEQLFWATTPDGVAVAEATLSAQARSSAAPAKR